MAGMRIEKNTVVTLSYQLSDAQGEFIEETEEPLVYLHGGYDGIFTRVEEALEGKEAGFKSTFHLEPEDAFGDYDADQVRVEPRTKFPEPLEIGMRFEGVPEDDDDDIEILTVTDLTDDTVVLDANHPLAGVSLRLAVEIIDVRAGTDEEIEHEHPHGAGGHDHDDEDDGPGGSHVH
jgi:FKBP-type peptidyl-prolyl cis-trans isomerase SlyD